MDGVSSVLNGLLPSATSTTSTNGANSTTSVNKTLTQDQFYKIMISELSNQDPLQPLDNQQFLGQLAQLQTLDATTKLSDGIQSLLLGQQISSAGALIGREVMGTLQDGSQVSGVVDHVLVNGSQVLLGIGSNVLPLSSVQQVGVASAAGQ